SGNGGGEVDNVTFGRSSLAPPTGTSHAGKKWVRRPGWLISNNNCVDCGLSIVLFLDPCRASRQGSHESVKSPGLTAKLLHLPGEPAGVARLFEAPRSLFIAFLPRKRLDGSAVFRGAGKR